jgi:flagellar motility protein MotE (MotC chaperone)
VKLVVALVAVIVMGGAVLGLGYAGILVIPGITPSKKSQAPKVEAGVVAAPTQRPVAAPTQEPIPEEKPEVVPVKDGSARLAKLWSSLDAASLTKIIEKWPEGEAVPIIAKMDDEKLGQLLAALPPDRAAQISRAIKAMPKGGK